MKQTVFITGASSGFGKETAILFQEMGWNVVATMRSPEAGAELSKLPHVRVVPLDVRDAASIEAAVAAAGDIDVLVNNAGFAVVGVFESVTREQVEAQYATNVFGLMAVTRAVLPAMRARGKGMIINVSSFGGRVGIPFGSLYNSSKFAVEGFSEALAYELFPLGIGVKIVEPGSSATNFRQGAEYVRSEIPAYQAMMNALLPKYGKVTEHLSKATPAEVARAIYEAATDGLPDQRYIVGEDAQFYIDMKRNLSDREFAEKMHAYFID